MKKTIISIACCALIAPLALAKDSKHKKDAATATEKGVTVTGTLVTAVEGATAASYQPAKTLVVREDDSKDTRRYVLDGPGHIVNTKGEVIRTAIRPGAHVRVYFASTGGARTIDHVVID
jgi:hypothetical protein